jgi:hypothetical protein
VIKSSTWLRVIGDAIAVWAGGDCRIACDTIAEMGGEEGVAGGAALVGTRAFDGILAFLDCFWLVFFSRLKKGLDPLGPDSVARTSRMNMNIHHFPFARGHRGGSRVMARCMRCVWKLGWKSTQ